MRPAADYFLCGSVRSSRVDGAILNAVPLPGLFDLLKSAKRTVAIQHT